MINETKEQVLEHVNSRTIFFCEAKKIDCNAYDLAKKINISRSLASQYLNELFKEDKLIKISSHPTYFLTKSIIEKKLNIKPKNKIYDSKEDLILEIGNNAFVSGNFISAIGYDLSLSLVISKCQSAVKYPPHGLPLLLYGEEGVGKDFIAKTVIYYAVNEKIIDANKKPFIFRSFGDVTKDSQALFGEKGSSNKGLIEEANDSFLIIKSCDKLEEAVISRLVDLINTGSYFNDHDAAKKKSDVRLIFITNKSNTNSISQSLIRSVPMVCQVPSLSERDESEKEELIIHFLKEEQSKIKRNINISYKALNALIGINYKNNIDGLISCIKTTCANAFLLNDDKNKLEILYNNIPVELINTYENSEIEDSVQLFDIGEYTSKKPNYLLVGMFNYMLDSHDEYLANKCDAKKLSNNWTVCMNDYYDFLIFKKKQTTLLIDTYEIAVNNIFKQILGRYNMYIPANCSHVIARMLSCASQSYSVIKNWESDNKERIEKMLTTLDSLYPVEFTIAKDIVNAIKGKLEINIGDINLAFIAINLRFYNKDNNSKKYLSLIVCHGYSTASSIADAVNKLLGTHIFDAIDMPLETNESEIVEEIRKQLKFNTACKDVLIMVDMGSLENIATKLKDVSDVSFGVINNVSTKTALVVGNCILQEKNIIDILDNVTEEIKTTSTYSEKVVKQKAIVFTTETGDVATERVITLLRNSFPKPVDIAVISCDYKSIFENLDNDVIFKRYDVLLVVGGASLKLKEHLYVPLENVVDFSEIDQLSKILKDYFTEEEIAIFNQNLIKNFSLENLMSNLTILNADMLISNITDALDKLQQKTMLYLNSKQKIGMYIHISCLIEKLVINPNQIIDIEEELTEEESKFVDDFNSSFRNIYKHYGIKIPINEIKYLYRYGFIKCNK